MNIAKDTLELLKRGAIDIFPQDGLEKKLSTANEEKRPLIVKLGIDPTGTEMHLGFTVVLRKMRQFQDLGHQAVLIIGDYTAMVGDPSGRDSTRPKLTHERIIENAKTYVEQAGKILDLESLKIVYNGDWFSKMNFSKLMELVSQTTVARMLERDDFNKRYKNNNPISLHEFFYPIMQGYDSLMIKADIELGGTDQRFNVAVGRDFQNRAKQPAQIALLMPILPGLDGEKKMSKSYENYIGINEVAQNMFGKLMSIPDKLMNLYFELLTKEDMSTIKRWIEGEKHPKEIKQHLAHTITTQYHGKEAAKNALEQFNQVFQKKELPDDIPSLKFSSEENWIVEIVSRTQQSRSNGESRRLIIQGAVKINNQKIADENAKLKLKAGDILKVGKRGFYKILL